MRTKIILVVTLLLSALRSGITAHRKESGGEEKDEEEGLNDNIKKELPLSETMTTEPIISFESQQRHLGGNIDIVKWTQYPAAPWKGTVVFV